MKIKDKYWPSNSCCFRNDWNNNKKSFCILLIAKGSWYGNANCSNVTVCIIYILMETIWNSICECNTMEKMGPCLKKKKKKKMSIAVFQEDIRPHWQSLSFWLGKVFKWVLTSVSMKWCVSRQEVRPMCFQHDLLKL